MGPKIPGSSGGCQSFLHRFDFGILSSRGANHASVKWWCVKMVVKSPDCQQKDNLALARAVLRAVP